MTENVEPENTENNGAEAAGATGATGATGSGEQRLPSVPDKEKKKKSKTGLKLLVVIAVVIVLLLLFGGGKKEGGIFSLVPANAQSFRAVDLSDEVIDSVASLPLWEDKEQAGKTARLEIYKNSLPGYAENGEFSTLASIVRKSVVATVEGNKLYVLDSGNPWQIERVYVRNISEDKGKTKVQVEGIDYVYKIVLGGKDYYLVKIASRIVISQSKELIAAAVNCHTGKASSLEDVGISWKDGAQSRVSGCLYQVPALAGRSSIGAITGFNSADYRKNVAELITFTLKPDGMVADMRVIDTSAYVGSSGGILSFIGSAILILLAVVIGLPMGFLLIVMLTAVYFYLAALIKGELVPVEPPELPELSKQMKDNLSGKKPPVSKTPADDKAEKGDGEQG